MRPIPLNILTLYADLAQRLPRSQSDDGHRVDLDNLDHDPELAQALGNMVVAWARTETALIKMLAYVTELHFNQAAAAYYAIPTFESRTNTLLALASEINSHTPIERFAEIADAVEGLKTLSSTRNEWVHAVWVSERGSKLVKTFNMKEGKSKRRAKQITANAVRQHITAVKHQRSVLEDISPIKIALKP